MLTKPIADLLKCALGEPTLLAEECWVRDFLARLDLDLAAIAIARSLSNAVAIVTSAGQTNCFVRRLKDEHPVHKTHHRQYDLRLRDCFTEACALAWASRADRGNPRWVLDEGKPDLQINKCWIEAKTIHASDEDRALTERLLKSCIQSGPIIRPTGGLLRKFRADLDDAVRKFNRVEADRRVVFFNLEQLDLLAYPFEKDLMQDLSKFARSASSRGVEVVICRSYDWQNPIEGCAP